MAHNPILSALAALLVGKASGFSASGDARPRRARRVEHEPIPHSAFDPAKGKRAKRRRRGKLRECV